MDGIYEAIANVGFPIAVTCFLLIRVEKKLDELNSNLIQMMEIILKDNN